MKTKKRYSLSKGEQCTRFEYRFQFVMVLRQGPDESGESLDVVGLQENLANHCDLLGCEIEHTIHHWIDGWHLRPIDRAVAEGINFGGPVGV